MVFEPGLGSKTDSVFYSLGVAQAMQQLADQYFFIGEMRGELVTTTNSTSSYLRELHNYSAQTSNAYDSAYVYYKVINNCNYYLAHRDTTLLTGSIKIARNEYVAMAAIRAWTYLQLARTYGDNIPFYTDPKTQISDVKEENVKHLSLAQIVDELAPELEKYAGTPVPTFNVTSYNIGTTNWGRAKTMVPSRIFIPVDVVLGEMYLEAGKYEKAAEAYTRYLTTTKTTNNNENINCFRIFTDATAIQNLPADFIVNLLNSKDEKVFNTITNGGYEGIFTANNNVTDIVSYIPMAVSSTNGKTTDIPLAFGLDYYSTDKSSSCPVVDAIQIAPSRAYLDQAAGTPVYYYPENPATTAYPDTVKVTDKVGDGRAAYYNTQGARVNFGSILNTANGDTTKVYISKPMQANVMLYRESTIWLHLAEALNRMGKTDLAFAILRNGISSYLEQIVNKPDVTVDPNTGDEIVVPAPAYKYISQESIDYLSQPGNFLSTEYYNIYTPDQAYGIHYRGAGLANAKGIEAGVSTKKFGSRNTSVGSEKNILYLPEPIITAKLAQLKEKFGVDGSYSDEQARIDAMEDILCDEYAMEFAFEGTRFYDLQRIARHKNESGIYGGNFGSKWFASKLAGNKPAKDLSNPANWYLPFK